MAKSDQKVDKLVRDWTGAIDLAREREKDWRKDGIEAEELYGEGKDQKPDTFPILYSNTETLAPSLYSTIPRPMIQRRFKDADPLGKAVSQAGQRVLEFLLDTNSEEYDSFDETIKDAVQDALLPGRAVTEFCYSAETVDVPSPRIVSEVVYGKTIVWNRFYHGYAKKWCDVPWCAAEMYLDKPAMKREFGAEIANETTYDIEGDEDKDKKDEGSKVKTNVKTACVYKIWDKQKKRVLWISPNYIKGMLREDEDELDLSGFYPFPRPMRFLRKSNNLLPTTLYSKYRTQAKELNVISARIIALLRMLKVRGLYDSALGEDIEEVLKGEDGDLMAAENVAAIQNTKGLEGAIWLMPLEKVITVLQQLYVEREQCKRVIYEITSLSDIVRGQTVASETLGAQKIKEQWVTLRLKNMQKEVQRYVRDSLRIMLEIAAKKFQVETWVKMTGLPFVTDQDLAGAKQIAQGAMMKAQEQARMNPGQPPQPPQIPPEVQQQLQAPQWTQVLGVMKNSLSRQYKVDIETNSTLDAEATEDKEMIAETMNAIAQFLNGVAPLIEQGILPFQAAQGMLLAIVRKFRFGPEVEDYIKEMKQPEPKPDPAAAKAQADAQMKQAEMQQKAVTDKATHEREIAETQMKNQEALSKQQSDERLAMHKAEQETARAQMKLANEEAAHVRELAMQERLEVKKAQIQRDTDLKKAALTIEGQITVAEITAGVKIATTTGPDGKPMKGSGSVDVLGKLVAGQDKFAQVLEQLMAAISAEKEIVRGPDGKPSGMRVKTQTVQ